MKKIQKNKAITLVALVITMVILIILAGITINMLFGENGIITKAKLGKSKFLGEDAREVVEQRVAALKQESAQKGVDTTLYDFWFMYNGDLSSDKYTDDMAIYLFTDEISAKFKPKSTKQEKAKSPDSIANNDANYSQEIQYKTAIVVYNDYVTAVNKNIVVSANAMEIDKDSLVQTFLENENVATTQMTTEFINSIKENGLDKVTLNSGSSGGPINTFTSQDFEYTGDVQEVTLLPGEYKLECWGAQGGYWTNENNNNHQNTGGYSVGTITLDRTTKLYVYVGGLGGAVPCSNNTRADGGFNGGGSCYGQEDWNCGGGGATDISLYGGNWDGTEHLYSRIIVAGGGGGEGEDSETGNGWAGGVTAVSYHGQATQTSAGTGAVFGKGAHTNYDGGAGGGGWYGGGAGNGSQTIPTSRGSGSDTNGGSGGSGYVYTESTAINYPSGCLLNSSYYLSNAQTKAGNTSFKSPTGTNETGHRDNGYARITRVIKQTSNTITNYNSQYVIFEVYSHYDGNCAVINELSILDKNDNIINYSISSVYDSSNQSYPPYWNRSNCWDHTQIDDGDVQYDSTTSLAVIDFTSDGVDAYIRLLLNINEIKEIGDVKVWVGGNNGDGSGRTPRSMSAYTTTKTDIDDIINNNIKVRSDDGLNLLKHIEIPGPLDNTTPFSFIK